MKKYVYISADYAETDGDRDVVEQLHTWGDDNYHIVEFTDLAMVKSGSVSNEDDCRICDLKEEFNRQINKSSYVIFVVGKNTTSRTAGSACSRASSYSFYNCYCTPYKGNRYGSKPCKKYFYNPAGDNGDNCPVNSLSYLRHEYEQAIKKNKNVIVVYNSTQRMSSWLPGYLKQYENQAIPFWTYNSSFRKVGNYQAIKKALGYE